MGWVHLLLAGTTDEGIKAKRKCQNDLGQTRYKLVKRPKVIEEYYGACGQIDQHNNHRQGGLKLEKNLEDEKVEFLMRHIRPLNVDGGRF